MYEKWTADYSKFLDTLVKVADGVIALLRTLIISVGVPVVLLFLMIVEQQRVVHGIELFETNGGDLPAFAAWSLVVLNMVLEFLIVYKEEEANGVAKDPESYRFSLRTFLKSVGYRFGFYPEELHPVSHRYRKASRLVTFAILSIALLGSMHEEMALQGSRAWHAALLDLILNSSLKDMAIWVSGLLFTFTAVLSAQTLANYIAITTGEILSSMRITAKKVDEEKASTITAVCEHCGWTKEYGTELAMSRGLQGHRANCKAASNSKLNGNGHKTTKKSPTDYAEMSIP